MYDPRSHAASPRAARYAIWAIALFVIGGLIATVSGLCTGVMMLTGVNDGSSEGQAIMMAGLVIGGIPFLFGLALIFIARKWGRKKAAPPNPDVFR
jgi:hypothetical protein